MIGFEIKKLVRRPIFLFVIVVITAIQVIVTMQELDAIRPDKAYIDLLHEYSEYTLEEAAGQIAVDSQQAEEEYYKNYTPEYEAGLLTIEEYREKVLSLPERSARFNATQRLLNQVEQLVVCQENMNSKGIPMAQLRILDETGWILADGLAKMWLCPLALAFVAVGILCEWHDTEMYDLICTTADGRKRTLRTKLWLCAALSALISLADALGIYLIPQWLYGTGAADAAIQSVSVYGNLEWGITLKTYAEAVCLARWVCNMLTCAVWVVIALLARKSYKATGIILLIVLMAVLAVG